MFIAQYPMGPNSIYPKVYSESSSRPPLQLNCIHKAKNVHCITRQTQMSNRIWVKHVFGGGGWVVKEEEWRRPQRLHHQSFPGACPSRTRPWWNHLFERKTFLLLCIKISIYKTDVMICWEFENWTFGALLEDENEFVLIFTLFVQSFLECLFSINNSASSTQWTISNDIDWCSINAEVNLEIARFSWSDDLDYPFPILKNFKFCTSKNRVNRTFPISVSTLFLGRFPPVQSI